MLKPEARALLLATLASCFLLTACGDSARAPTGKTPAANSDSKPPKANGVTADMVAAVAPETSSAEIGVHFALANAPTINEGLPLNVVIVPHREFASVG